MIQLKRAYDKPEPRDGVRFLIERLWPRGVCPQDRPPRGWVAARTRVLQSQCIS
jgi:uncharacterized protein YeaO (DUF488 family)